MHSGEKIIRINAIKKQQQKKKNKEGKISKKFFFSSESMRTSELLIKKNKRKKIYDDLLKADNYNFVWASQKHKKHKQLLEKKKTQHKEIPDVT